MPLTVTVPAVPVPAVQPPAVNPPPITVTDAQMVTSLEAEGYGITAPGAVTPPPAPPTPPPVGKPARGWFHGAPDACPLTSSIALDYGYSNDATTYTQAAAQAYANAGKRLMLKIGDLTVVQATALAGELIAGGQANAIIPIMWEGNQGVNGWETDWNENADTAAQFIAKFQNIAAAMRAVPGAKFLFAWCPNVNQAGNQKAGRNQTDTWPGTGVNGDVVIAPDGYDNPKNQNNVPQVMAGYQVFIDFAKTNGAVFAGLCEWGPNGWDDGPYITATLQLLDATGCLFQVLFSATTKQGGAFDSELATKPNSLAAYKANA